jgi:hypothetical protein
MKPIININSNSIQLDLSRFLKDSIRLFPEILNTQNFIILIKDYKIEESSISLFFY